MTDFRDICTILTFVFSTIAIVFSVLTIVKNRHTERLIDSIEKKNNTNA